MVCPSACPVFTSAAYTRFSAHGDAANYLPSVMADER
jgi:hypothetical protein